MSEHPPTSDAGNEPANPQAEGSGASAPRKRYSDGVVKKAKEPFAYQAAKIAMWAPFVGVAVAFLSRFVNASAANAGDAPLQRDVSFFAIGAMLLLCLLSLLMGGVALAGIRKNGTKGLLAGPVVGMLVSVLVLSWTVLAIAGIRQDIRKKRAEAEAKNPAMLLKPISEAMVGDWEWSTTTDKGTVRVRLTLRGDGTGAWKVESPPLDVPSHWRLDQPDVKTLPVLTLQFDKPIETPQHAEGVHWALIKVGKDQMALGNKAEDGRVLERVFNRVKP